MWDKNLAAVLFKKGDLKPVERPIPEPRAGEILLRMQQIRICGSDITLWKNGSIGHYIVKTPLVLGHEASGVASKLGHGVTTLQIGDRVAIEPGVPCRFCEYCKSGKYNLCPDVKFCFAPPDDEVQLQMQQVGICGSDVHFWQDGGIGHFIVDTPMVLGHEASGVVSKLGEGVTSLKVDDRVAIEPGVPCRVCNYCKSGRYNLCSDVKFCATPPVDGSLTRYFVHPADFCFKLPDHVSNEEGALLEPLSVAVHSCNRSGVTLGSTVLICGAGPIGLVMLLTAKAKGAAEVCITDIATSRLEIAKKMGATHTVDVRGCDPQEVARQVEENLGSKAEITIECSGAASSIKTAVYATRSGGCVMLVGLGQSEVNIPIADAILREVDIRGNFRYANCYPTALAMVASGKVDVKPLITHRFPLEESIQAFETSLKAEGIKVMINCSK